MGNIPGLLPDGTYLPIRVGNETQAILERLADSMDTLVSILGSLVSIVGLTIVMIPFAVFFSLRSRHKKAAKQALLAV
jgi:predicted PurR-regulated permease PerM